MLSASNWSPSTLSLNSNKRPSGLASKGGLLVIDRLKPRFTYEATFDVKFLELLCWDQAIEHPIPPRSRYGYRSASNCPPLQGAGWRSFLLGQFQQPGIRPALRGKLEQRGPHHDDHSSIPTLIDQLECSLQAIAMQQFQWTDLIKD